MFIWVALKENVREATILLTITEPCSNPEFPQEQLKSYPVQGNLKQTFPHGLVTWKVMQ